jgi:lipopolysaccharide/colanic/teichoic acid biosynthesis glycosyltransferase
MRFRSNTESFILFAGDLIFWVAALWITLAIRFAGLPSLKLFVDHLVPFSLLFPAWFVVFFLFDLYTKHTSAFKRKMFARLSKAQITNSIVAVVFFYFIPYLGITPKTVLFIYLAVSFLLVAIWRIYLINYAYVGRLSNALVVGEGKEIEELREEIKNNSKYGLKVVDDAIIGDALKKDIQIIILDLSSDKTRAHGQEFYELALRGVTFVDVRDFYENIFDRIPLSLVDARWVIKNISRVSRMFYDAAKRTMDIVISAPLFLLSILLYPFVAIAVKIEDGGPVFIFQDRVGKDNKLVKIFKFRSMTGDDKGKYAAGGTTSLKETKVGKFLRKTRLDEIPQLWNVIRGDLSLVGPRPELPALAEIYKKDVPYYDMRHIIQPGLSGWAQIYHEQHPHHGMAVNETREKLSYDLFYVKNRSFLLDLKIAFRTISLLLSMAGR